MKRHKVFLDANVILDFSEPKCKKVFSFFKVFVKSCDSHSEFFTTNYIYEIEICHMSFLDELRDLVLEYPIDLEILYTKPPSRGMDYGEWSIKLAIDELSENKEECCVLTNDQNARNFFEEKNLLPCKHINPPEKGVGGTRGILKHLLLIEKFSEEEVSDTVKKMKEAGRRV